MIKKHDFIAARIYQPQASLEELYANGITPDNTEIKDIDYYKSNETIQKLFTENDVFNEQKFQDFYNGMVRVFNVYADDDYSKKALDAIESSPRDWTQLDSKKYNTGATIKINNLPNRMTQGMSTEPVAKFTDDEIAQANFVRDENGNVLDWTPNDKGGLWKGIFREPLALAIYEEDGFHEENGIQVFHQKGESKKDKNWNPFYEELGDKNAAGRQILKYGNTLTKEGAWINDYDFMDSDGFNKSIAGTVAKTAVQIAPYLFGPTRAIFRAVSAAKELATILPTFMNSINAIVSDNDENKVGKKLNKWANKMQGFKSGMSQYGNDNFMSFENLGNIIASSVGQLYQQRTIGRVPLMFSKNANPKTARYLSAAYMALTTSQDSYNSFKEAGASDTTAGLGALASFAAMYGLMSTDYFGQWLTKDTWAETRTVSQQTAREMAESLNRRYYNNAQGELKGLMTKKWFRDLHNNTTNALKSLKNVGSAQAVMSTGNQFVQRSLNEAVEETTEEITLDTVKGIFSGIEQFLNIKLSADQYERLDFNWSLDSALQRYGASFLGGAIGGAVFEGVNQLELINNPKTRAFMQSETTKRLLWLYASGHGDEIEAEVDRLYKSGKLGNKNLSTKRRLHTDPDGEEVEIFDSGTDTDNQNLAIYQALKTELRNIKHFLTSNRWMMSNKELAKKMLTVKLQADEANESVQEYIERTGENPIIDIILEGNFLDYATNDMFEEFNSIYNLENEIKTKRNEIIISSTNEDLVKDELKSNEDLKYLEHQLKNKKQIVNDILSGKYADYYIEYGMFAADKVAQDRIIKQNELFDNLESYVKIIHHEDYNELSTDDKFFRKKEWELYRNATPENQMKNLFHVFKSVNEHISNIASQNSKDLSQVQLDPLFNPNIERTKEEIDNLNTDINALEQSLLNKNIDSDSYKDISLQLAQKKYHRDFLNEIFDDKLNDNGQNFVNDIVSIRQKWNNFKQNQINKIQEQINQNNIKISELELSDNQDEVESLKFQNTLYTTSINDIKNLLPINDLCQFLEGYHNNFISGQFIRTNDKITKLITEEAIDIALESIFGENYNLKSATEEISKSYISELTNRIVGIYPEDIAPKDPKLDKLLQSFISNLKNDPLNIDVYYTDFVNSFDKSYKDAIFNAIEDSGITSNYEYSVENEVNVIFTQHFPIKLLINTLLKVKEQLPLEKSTPTGDMIQSLFVQINERHSKWADIINNEIKTYKVNPEEYRINESTEKELNEISSIINLVINSLDAASNGYNHEANEYRKQLKHDLLAEITDNEAILYKNDLKKWDVKIQQLKQLAENNRISAEKYQTEVTLNMESLYMDALVNGLTASKLNEIGVNTSDIWKSVIKDEIISFENIKEDDYEHFGELVLSFRQELYKAFQNITTPLLGESEKADFYDKLINCFGTDLWQGRNGEMTNDPNYKITGNQLLSHFLGIVGQDQDQFGSLWKFVVENDEYKKFTPFSSQLESIRDAMSLIINPGLYNEIGKAIYRSQKKETNEYIKNRDYADNLMVILGGPGSGKTSAVARAIRLMVKALNGDVIVSASTDLQLKNLLNNIDGDIAYTSNEKLGEILNAIGYKASEHIDIINVDKRRTIKLKNEFNPKKYNNFDDNAKYKVLIVDEFTYLTRPEIEAIVKSAKKSGFIIIGLGDDAQNGITTEIKEAGLELESDFQDLITNTTPYLTISMRANNRAQYLNANILGKEMRDVSYYYQQHRDSDENALTGIMPKNIKLYYSENDGDIFGAKFETSSYNDRVGIIKNYTTQFTEKDNKKTVLIITDRKLENYSDIASERIVIVNPKDAQGREADYVMIDRAPMANGYKAIKDFNTLITRAKQAVIYLYEARPDNFSFEKLDNGYLPANQLGSEESREKHKLFTMSPYKMDVYSSNTSSEIPKQKTNISEEPEGNPETPPAFVTKEYYEVPDDLSLEQILQRYDTRDKDEKLHDWYRYDTRKRLIESNLAILNHDAYVKWLFNNNGKQWLKESDLSPLKNINLSTDAQWDSILNVINCLSVYRLEKNSYNDWVKNTHDFITNQLSNLPLEVRQDVNKTIDELINATGSMYYIKNGIVYYVYSPKDDYIKAIPISHTNRVDGALALETKFELTETLVGLSSEGSVFTKISDHNQNGIYHSSGRVYANKDRGDDSDNGKTFINFSHIPWMKDSDYYHNDNDKENKTIKQLNSRVGVQDILPFNELWGLMKLTNDILNDKNIDNVNGDKDIQSRAQTELLNNLGIESENIEYMIDGYSSSDVIEQYLSDLSFADKLKELSIVHYDSIHRIITALFEFTKQNEEYSKNFTDVVNQFATYINPVNRNHKVFCFDVEVNDKESKWNNRQFVFKVSNIANGILQFEVREVDKNTGKVAIDPEAIVDIDQSSIDWLNFEFLQKIFSNDNFKELVESKSNGTWIVNQDVESIVKHLESGNLLFGLGNISKIQTKDGSDLNPRYYSLGGYDFVNKFNSFFNNDIVLNDFTEFLNSNPKFKNGIYTNIKGFKNYLEEDSTNYKGISSEQNNRLKMDIKSFLLPLYNINDITNDSIDNALADRLDKEIDVFSQNKSESKISNHDKSVTFEISKNSIVANVNGNKYKCQVISVLRNETIVFNPELQQVYTITEKIDISPIDNGIYVGILKYNDSIGIVYESNDPFIYKAYNPGFDDYDLYQYLDGKWYDQNDILINAEFIGSVSTELPNTNGIELDSDGNITKAAFSLLPEVLTKLTDYSALTDNKIEIIKLNHINRTATIKVDGQTGDVSWKPGISLRNFGLSPKQTEKLVNVINNINNELNRLKDTDSQFFENFILDLPTKENQVKSFIENLNKWSKQQAKYSGYYYEFEVVGKDLYYKSGDKDFSQISKLLFDKNIDFNEFEIQNKTSNTAKIVVSLTNGTTDTFEVEKNDGYWNVLREEVGQNKTNLYLQIANLLTEFKTSINLESDPENTIDYLINLAKQNRLTIEDLSITQLDIPNEVSDLLIDLTNCNI